jgi:hypothetical protein
VEFVVRLAGDLARMGGHRPWVDLADIEKGGTFDVRIEQGINSAKVLLAVMTPGSAREESVCRDEVVFALNRNVPVVPLLVDAAVSPPLLLARRNWIDFSADYKDGLGQLLRYLKGDVSALRGHRLGSVTGFAPLDFGPELDLGAADFTGRQWLTAEIDAWLAGGRQRALVVMGEPGVGKSALTAWPARRRPESVAVHFCTRRNTRSLDAREFVASLVGQLHACLPGFAAKLDARNPGSERRSANDAFGELVVEPARELTP